MAHAAVPYNVNVGVLGHVDSGKTSLGEQRADYSRGKRATLTVQPPPTTRRCRRRRRYPPATAAAVAALSTTLSTAALDKNPQSRERGITLDLGFSSFTVRCDGGCIRGCRAGWCCSPHCSRYSGGSAMAGQPAGRAARQVAGRYCGGQTSCLLAPSLLPQVPAPPHIAAAGYEQVQFTLVDCPGHASLIRTIIGGAQASDTPA